MPETLTLRAVVTTADWVNFHAIRKAELFDARDRGHVYDADHADDRTPGNTPMLLCAGNDAVGVLRIDDLGQGRAALRLLAIRRDQQRHGHGARMVQLALAELRKRGCTTVLVNAAPDAVGFYERLGFRRAPWPDDHAATSVQMALSLATPAA